jgi:hypothetical protein
MDLKSSQLHWFASLSPLNKSTHNVNKLSLSFHNSISSILVITVISPWFVLLKWDSDIFSTLDVMVVSCKLWLSRQTLVCENARARVFMYVRLYEDRLKSTWTHLIIPSWNFVEVRWRTLFRNTSLGKRCASYNAPPTSRKRAADRWSLRNLPRSSLFMVGKAQKSHGARSGLYGGWSKGVPPIHFFQAEHRIQFRSRPMRFLGFSNHEKGAPMQEISKWSTVCSTFSRSG